KYILDLLEETGMLGSKPFDRPMYPNLKLAAEGGDALDDPERNRRLVGKLNYLTVTLPDIAFPVSIVSRFLSSPRFSHRLSAESEYRAMAHTSCELMWIKQLLGELGFGDQSLIQLWYDNQATIHIASNPIFHERTNHIEVDCHFIRENVQQKLISTSFVRTVGQLADVFTKSLDSERISYLCNKLGMYDIYTPACGGVLAIVIIISGLVGLVH
ncbi:hypothetical protein CFOL_v3_24568, partial [Cephalotus follicularis]